MSEMCRLGFIRKIASACNGRRRRKRTALQAAIEEYGGIRLDGSLLDAAEKTVLERVAHVWRIDPYEMLSAVAATLGLRPMFHPSPPDSGLLSRIDFSPDELRERAILPQRSIRNQSEYTLVTAAPSLLAVEEFQREGTEVLLGIGRDLDAAWSRACECAETVLGVPVIRLLLQLAAESYRCGASEVFLGHPDAGHYEFTVRERRYQGAVSRLLVPTLLDALAELRRLTIATASEPFHSVAISVTKSFARSIVCLSWEAGEARRCAPSLENVMDDRAATSVVETSIKELHSDRVIMLDDDCRFAEVASRLLRAKGYDVRLAHDGLQVLRELQSDRRVPAVVVCDVHMPSIEGRDFVYRLKQAHPSISIIALTNDDSAELEAEMALLGVHAHILKSRDPEVLLAWVRSAVERNPAALRCAEADRRCKGSLKNSLDTI